MLKKKLKIILICILSLVFLPTHAMAEGRKKIVIITINTINYNDLLADSYFKELAKNSIIGLMNSKSSGNMNEYKPYLTLGSGQKSDASFDYTESIKIDENTSSKYEEITLNRSSMGNIANLSINKLKKLNSKTLYNALPGKLGSILKSKGLKRSFLGGFFFNGSYKSPGFFVLMDEDGLIDKGEIDGIFTDNKIDQKKLFQEFINYKASSDIVLIELGDIERLYLNRSLYSEAAYNQNKNEILSNYALIVQDIINNMNFDNEKLFILTPYSADINRNSELLSPFLIYDGARERGIATSKSTRREGIVTALDFAPSVLKYFNISTESFLGYPIESIAKSDNTIFLQSLEKKVYSTSTYRSPIIKTYAAAIMITLVLYLLKNLFNIELSLSILNFMIKSILLIPFAFVMEGMIVFENIAIKGLFIISLSVVLAIIIDRIAEKTINRVKLIAFINSLCLIIDLLTGQNLLKYSIFSYDPCIGARYYGLGNEFLGVIAGCTLVLFGLSIERGKKLFRLYIPYLIFVTLITGLPNTGSNVGGFLTLFISFTIYVLLEKNISFLSSLKILSCSMLISSIIFIFANLIAEDKAHLGKMFDMINADGIIYFSNIVLRKINMSLKLIKYTIWTKVLVLLIISAIILIKKPNKAMKDLFITAPYTRNLILASSISGCVAILLNDSGIVTAAVIMLYTVFSMMLTLQTKI
ncbi:hypothetical protein OXPF_14310 [Oxobacter pfennigii]|uniref:Uncharacterized protein n=1 Tax=Oxobacter pfennigii TaxID=36849 RepID=A0A0P8YCR1_9CLOT|nr:hypothetical protein [Oxobacter pfennigii]KPU44953.1 hypothetical protein OXPF_14310 [Oxobacter pfennigii]